MTRYNSRHCSVLSRLLPQLDPALARSVFFAIFFATSLPVNSCFLFFASVQPCLKNTRSTSAIVFFKHPTKKNGILLLQTEGACLCQPISWSMAAILRDSVVVVVVVAVARTRPRAIPLAMITMRKSIRGFPFLPYIGMGLRLAARRAAGAPL